MEIFTIEDKKEQRKIFRVFLFGVEMNIFRLILLHKVVKVIEISLVNDIVFLSVDVFVKAKGVVSLSSVTLVRALYEN